MSAPPAAETVYSTPAAHRAAPTLRSHHLRASASARCPRHSALRSLDIDSPPCDSAQSPHVLIAGLRATLPQTAVHVDLQRKSFFQSEECAPSHASAPQPAPQEYIGLPERREHARPLHLPAPDLEQAAYTQR